MPRNSGGTYSLPAGNPVVTGTVISSTWANTTLSDIATEMTDSLDRSGKGAMLAALQLFSGVIGTPGLSWSTETTSGLYRAAAGDFRYSISAVDKVQITTNGLRAADGVVATPGFSFISDPDTGWYRVGANVMGAASNGVQRFQIDTTAISSLLPNYGVTGSAGAPTYSFSGDPDTGMYSLADGALRFSNNGTQTFALSSLGAAVFTSGSAGTPSISFLTDSDTGMYTSSANELDFTTNGVFRLGITANQVISRLSHAGVDGTAGTPSYGFESDTDTGMYRVGANVLGFSAGATAVFDITTTAFEIGVNTFTFGTANSGVLNLNVTNSTTATAGGNTLPATVRGFVNLNINGSARKIPYYDP